MESNLILTIFIISTISMLCQVVSWWLSIPSILFLLLSGLILGPISHVINPDLLLGELLAPLISVAVAIILFEGSLTLKIRNIKQLKNSLLALIILGGFITFIGTMLAAWMIFEINFKLALLIGAILTVTGPTVIMPMLKAIRPNNKIREMLKWEGIILDPLAVILSVLVFDLVTQDITDGTVIKGLLFFLVMTITGGFIGFIFGHLLSYILIKHFVPKYLTNIAVLTILLMAFVVSNYFFHETGMLAVTIMGITVSNQDDVDVKEIMEFKETLSTLLLSGVFILLASKIQLDTLVPLVVPSFVLFLVMQFIIRPAKVFLTTFNSEFTHRERLMVSWIAPRGIVAVAIASFFQIKLIALGYDGAEYLVPIVFLIIVWSVMLPSLTGGWLVKLLGIENKNLNGILILGANNLSLAIAKEFKKHNLNILIVDNDWQGIANARMEGIKTYYGNILSQDAEYFIDIQSIRTLLCLNPSQELAALANFHFKKDLEKKNAYYLQTDTDAFIASDRVISKTYKGRRLFGERLTYELLSTDINDGYIIKSTELTDKYLFEDFIEQNQGSILLFAINNGLLECFGPDSKLAPEPGCIIISLNKKNKT